MPHRMEALLRGVVGIVGSLTGTLRPSDERVAHAVPHLLGLLVQLLFRSFFPMEPQVPNHGNEPQSDATARREQHGSRIPVVAVCL